MLEYHCIIPIIKNDEDSLIRYEDSKNNIYIVDMDNKKMVDIFEEQITIKKRISNNYVRGNIDINLYSPNKDNDESSVDIDYKFQELLKNSDILCFLEYSIENISFINWILPRISEISFLSFSLKNKTHIITNIVKYYYSYDTLPQYIKKYYIEYKLEDDKLLMHYLHNNTYLKYSIEQDICWISENITHLDISYIICDFELDNLPSNLVYLSLQYLATYTKPFNKPLNNLPYGLKYLIIKQVKMFNELLQNLPPSLEYLVLEGLLDFNQPLDCLPQFLKYLILNQLSHNYSYELDRLPDSLEHLYLDFGNKYDYNKNVIIPKNVKYIHYPWINLIKYNLPNKPLKKISSIPAPTPFSFI